MPDPYPLLLVPQLKPKVWGGRRLEGLGKVLPAGVGVGESWELCDLDETSASGGGGGSARSIIANGPLAGRTLREAIALWEDRLIEPGSLTPEGRGFPLLVKFLDACENLSVQVHPSPAYAAAHAGAHLKTESWFILDAVPGSVIYSGFREGVRREDILSHLSPNGRSFGAGIVGTLAAIPAIAGECHTLPSGTCHALGAGVLVAEVQTPSDTTFRLYDWGRAGRELHVEPALECIDFGPSPTPTRLPEAGACARRLAETAYYTIDAWRLGIGGGEAGMGVTPSRESCTVLMVVGGSATVSGPGLADVGLPLGSTVVIPAAISPSVRVSGSGIVLRIGV